MSWDFHRISKCVCLFLAVYSVYHGGFPCVSAELEVTNPLSQTGPSHMVRHRPAIAPPSPRAGHAEEPLRPQNSMEAPRSLSNSLAEKAFRCFYVVNVCTVQHVSYLFQAELSSKLESLWVLGSNSGLFSQAAAEMFMFGMCGSQPSLSRWMFRMRLAMMK